MLHRSRGRVSLNPGEEDIKKGLKMSIKSILVHLAMDDDCSTRLESAVDIAKNMKAHLICLYVAHPVHMPAGAQGRGASSVFIAEATERAKAASDDIKNQAQTSCESAGISWEWVYGEEDHLERLLEHLHRTDLTILTQVSLDRFEDRLMYQTPEVAIQEAGGPVLILPRVGGGQNFGNAKHILINWDFSKESIRAVRGALPLIHTADKVSVLAAHQDPKEHTVPAKFIHYLQLHGITAELLQESDHDSIGEMILATAEANGCDRIVMGAYHEVSLRNRIFGGVTRHVISNTNVPLVLTH